MELKPYYVAKTDTLVPDNVARRMYKHRLPNGDSFYSLEKRDDWVYVINYSAHYRMLWRQVKNYFGEWKCDLLTSLKDLLKTQ